jgi:23S rRNA pseudouridine2605 synthase
VRGPDDVRARRTVLKPSGAISLARALSKFGVCSRREAERWIAAGRVTVNAGIERDPSRWIEPRRDRVSVDGRPVGDETPRVVIAFHKPVGFVTTRVDPGGRATVYDALGDLGRWVFPVGRLDRDTSGLLILTNDHRLGERLTAPEHDVPKTYHALVVGMPEQETLRALREGLPLEGGELTRPARVRVLGSRRGSTWLEIVLREGRNRQVRRMCALVGHEVQQLVRVAIGDLGLAGLAVGEWRELESAEVARLVASSARPGPPIMEPSPAGPDAAGARSPRRR